MGIKWLRIAGAGNGNGALQWPYIEHERGKFEIDPVLDKWLPDVQRCGINLILGLEPWVGNYIYEKPPRKTNWLDARWREFNIRGLGDAGVVDQNPEMFDAWLKYVDFMARHFKGRAFIYEIGNEWNDWGWDDPRAVRYMKIFEKAYETIKKADPDARVMPGSINLFAPDLILALLGQERRSGVWDGRLVANGGDPNDLTRSTVVVAENVKVTDAEVNVDALNRGVWGVLLRYSSPQNFLMAGLRNVHEGNSQLRSLHGLHYRTNRCHLDYNQPFG